MTRLLVSVRTAAEAELACRGGADLVDVKEPARGPLGAADPATVREIVALVAARAPVSVALGEWHEANGLPPDVADGVRYAKIGLARCGRLPDWPARWRASLASLPRGVERVAVAYADWGIADSPAPHDVLARAADCGCRAILLDTFDKRAGALQHYLATASLARFIDAARRRRLLCVVAGGLSAASIAEVLPLAPDYVGVRGAACRGDRQGPIELERVRALAGLLRSARSAAALASPRADASGAPSCAPFKSDC